ncbi:hypothetical protein QOZ80_6AG0514950 [Eleusine coracana subsp. coracana]|nr:hypothetical protein QOZ80_6AG0514950 [Eleusine coracana subsp. coracana]
MAAAVAVVAPGGLDDPDAAFFSRRGGSRRCCCFPWPSSSSSSPHARRADEEWWHGVGEGGGGSGAARRRWWRRGVDALMKVREWSELVAGPRWKTFIRRFRRLRHGGAAAIAGAGGGSGGGGGTGRKLNYDPLSYALNFDEGHHGGSSPESDGFAGYRDFSARFVAPPGSTRASMDLGGRDAPPLFYHPQPLPPQSPRTPTNPPAAAALRG